MMRSIISLCSILVAIYITSTISDDTQKLTKEWIFQFDLQNQNNWDTYQITQNDENVLNGESNGCTSRIPVIFKKVCVTWNDNDGFALKFKSSSIVDPIYDDMLWYYGDHETATNAEKIANAKYIDLEDKELSEIVHGNDPSIALRRKLINRKTAAQKCHWYGGARACVHIGSSNKNLMTVSVGINEADNNNDNYFGAEYNDYGDYYDDVDYQYYIQQQQALYNQQWANYLQQLYYQNMFQQQQYAANAYMYNEYNYNHLDWDYDIDGLGGGVGDVPEGQGVYVLSAAGKRLFTGRDLYMFPKFTAEPPYPVARTNVLLLDYISSYFPIEVNIGAKTAPTASDGSPRIDPEKWKWQYFQDQLHDLLYNNRYSQVKSKRAELEAELSKQQKELLLTSGLVEHAYLNARGYSIGQDTSFSTEAVVLWMSKTRYSAVRYAEAQTLGLPRSDAKVITTYISPEYWTHQRPDPHTMSSAYKTNFGRTQTGLSILAAHLKNGVQYHDPFFHKSYNAIYKPEEMDSYVRVNLWYELWINAVTDWQLMDASFYTESIGMEIAKIITKGSIFNVVRQSADQKPPIIITDQHVMKSLNTVVQLIKKHPLMFDDYQLAIYASKYKV